MVRARAEALRATGHHVYVEDQNRFVLKGKAATLGGKPDLVAVRDGCALVVDCKSGKRRNKDFFQVLTYMLVLPHVHRACKGLSVAGELQYQDGSLSVEPERLTPQIKTLIRETVERVATETEPARMPSVAECRFCELCEDDCPDRIEDPPPRGESIEHDLF
jgi:predicted RecB family nuclease